MPANASVTVNLVLEGGGMKGIGLVGALRFLEQQGVRAAGIAGSSVGALVAALYAAGFGAEELQSILLDADFKSFLDGRRPRTLRLLLKRGFHSGEKLRTWVAERLAAKKVFKFRDIGTTDLRIIASDLTSREVVMFTRSGHPEMLIADAVRMSAAIPLFFQPVQLGSQLMVDGGLLSNYPLWVFSDSEVPTIGVRLGAGSSPASASPPSSLAGFLAALFSTMLEAHDKRDARALGSEMTIHVPTGSVSTTQFDLGRTDREALLNRGYRAAGEFWESKGRQLVALEARSVTPNGAGGELSTQAELAESLRTAKKTAAIATDTTTKLTLLLRRLFVDRPDATLETEEEGINSSAKDINYLRRSVFADSSVDSSQLGIEATIEMGGERFVPSTDHQCAADGRSCVVKFGFKGRILKPSEPFKLAWRFRWPGAVARNSDYWIFSHYQWTENVGRAWIEAAFHDEPADLEFLEEVNDQLRVRNMPCVDRRGRAGSHHAYCVEIANPGRLYVLRWRIG